MNSEQQELDFNAPRSDLWDGINHLEIEMLKERRELAVKMGLPLDRQVEVTLSDGRTLKGLMKVHERDLFIPQKRSADILIEIGTIVFRACDISSCLRLDD